MQREESRSGYFCLCPVQVWAVAGVLLVSGSHRTAALHGHRCHRALMTLFLLLIPLDPKVGMLCGLVQKQP